MVSLLGLEYCKLDNNGRFKFPIGLKRQLEDEDMRFVFRPSVDAECLELWTYESFRAEVEFLKSELNPYSAEDRYLRRKLTRGKIVEMDNNDRLVIPNEMRQLFKTSKEIVLQSTGDCLEIWDYDTYCRDNENNASYSQRIDERLGKVRRNSNVSESQS